MRVCTCPSSEQLLALFVNEVSFSPGSAKFDVQCIQRSAPAEGRGQRCTPFYSTISVLNLQFLIRFIVLKQCYKTTSKRKCEGRQPSADLHASRIQAKALSKCLCSLSSIRPFRGFRLLKQTIILYERFSTSIGSRPMCSWPLAKSFVGTKLSGRGRRGTPGDAGVEQRARQYFSFPTCVCSILYI